MCQCLKRWTVNCETFIWVLKQTRTQTQSCSDHPADKSQINSTFNISGCVFLLWNLVKKYLFANLSAMKLQIVQSTANAMFKLNDIWIKF